VYRFLLRPAWIVSHVLVLLLIFVLFNLGLWQLRRLDEKQAANELIEERTEVVRGADPSFERYVAPSDPVEVGDDLLWYRQSVTGTYLADEQVLLRSRSLDGRPGFWVLTPLERSNGSVVVVNRGWVPFQSETDGSDLDIPVVSGEVTVDGYLQASVEGPKPAEGENTTIAHVDLDWFDERLDADVFPVYLQLRSQDPEPTGDLPVVLPSPELSEGPHFGYAMQWFIFMTIAIVGYPIVLYKVAHGRGKDGTNAPPEYDLEVAPGEPVGRR
jgi:cytochrome oxidase assembly protein ShyY1